MRIAVIGAGRVGTALGGRWHEQGHDVVYGVRNPADGRHEQLPAVASTVEAARGADVVLIALPWDGVEGVASSLEVGDAVVVDATNPPAAGARQLETDPHLSGAELVAGWLGGGRVVKAFNTTGAENMADPSYPGGLPLMLVAGDDADAKQVVSAMAAELGFDAVDAGPLAAARDLEHVAALWIRLAHSLGHGRSIAFALLRR